MGTSSKWGGWHHVKVHVRKYESYGFRYNEKLNKEKLDGLRESVNSVHNQKRSTSVTL